MQNQQWGLYWLDRESGLHDLEEVCATREAAESRLAEVRASATLHGLYSVRPIGGEE